MTTPASPHSPASVPDRRQLEEAMSILKTLMQRHGRDAFLPLAERLMDELDAVEERERKLRKFFGSDLAA
jgi:hypothetical protein